MTGDCVREIRSYQDLIAWQKGMDLVELIYQLSAEFPSDERFGLTAQVRRAAVSIPCNVAEGFGRSSRSDYVRFLDIARGSAYEVETQVLIAVRIGFAEETSAARAMSLVKEIQRILAGLMNALRKSNKENVRGP